jgi:hypothetical protein
MPGVGSTSIARFGVVRIQIEGPIQRRAALVHTGERRESVPLPHERPDVTGIDGKGAVGKSHRGLVSRAGRTGDRLEPAGNRQRRQRLDVGRVQGDRPLEEDARVLERGLAHAIDRHARPRVALVRLDGRVGGIASDADARTMQAGSHGLGHAILERENVAERPFDLLRPGERAGRHVDEPRLDPQEGLPPIDAPVDEPSAAKPEADGQGLDGRTGMVG